VGLPEAIRAVLLGTVASGVAGAILGGILGKATPGFFASRGGGDPVESGVALGAIAGLLLGAAGCVVLAAVKMWAEARFASRPGEDKED
jgi:hypothetical protein